MMKLIRTYEELEQHKSDFLNDECLAFDIETTGLSPFRDKVALVQFYSPKHDLTAVVQTPGGVIPPAMREIIENANRLVGHNLVGFDLLFILQAGIGCLKPEIFDTLVSEQAVSSSTRHGVSKALGPTLKRRLGISVNKDIDHTGWDGPLSDRQVEYAVNDVIHLPDLMKAQIALAEETNQLPGLELEMAIIPAVTMMNFNGMPISRPHFDLYRGHLQSDLIDAEATLRAAFPGVENPNSTYQLQDDLAIHYGIETDSTAKDVLQQWVYMGGKPGELAQIILDYRYIKQRLNMYDDKFWPKFVYRGRVKSHFWQCGAGTTRFTSSGPNLQQIPRDARWVFGHYPGMTFIKSDYAQIEVRVAAAVAEDEAMLSILEQEDVHTAIAAQVFEVAPHEITKDQRQKSKAMVFTLLFGGGPNALYTYARRMGADMTESDARLLISRFFRRFRGLHAMRRQATNIARNRRVATVRLPSGLKRVLAGNNLKPTTLLNTQVQGSAAVGLKWGILEAHKRGLSKYLVAQVHDELDAFVPDSEAEDYRHELEESMLWGMTQLWETDFFVKVESDVGPAWGETPAWAEKRLIQIGGNWRIMED